ncbi:hypothetical protein HDU96_000637 [Phlyctochytrium bullatum]|nr:hypothetical protein HDU96_000637 [Phlyctochytrium bullatum]
MATTPSRSTSTTSGVSGTVIPQPPSPTPKRLLSPHEKKTMSIFNSPSSRIILTLPILPRIAPSPNSPSSPTATSPQHPVSYGASHHHVPTTTSGKPSQPIDGAAGPAPPPRTRRVAVAITGDMSGAPVFFHVGMGGGRFIAWLLHDLGVEHGLKIIVPDRPGMGLSDPWDLDAFPDPTLHTTGVATESSTTCWRGGYLDFADITIQIADALNIQQFAQMGMSCGCLYALAVAARYPDRLLPTPMQLFSPWIPPSMPGCNAYARAAGWVPTAWFVGVLGSVMRLGGDPRQSERVDQLMGAVRWIAEMFTSPLMWNRKGGHGEKDEGDSAGSSRVSSSTSLVDEKDGAGRRGSVTGGHAHHHHAKGSLQVAAAANRSNDSPPKNLQSAYVVRTPSLSCLNCHARSPTLFNRTIHSIVTKLEAISYTMMNNPGMSPQEAEARVIEMLTPPSKKGTPTSSTHDLTNGSGQQQQQQTPAGTSLASGRRMSSSNAIHPVDRPASTSALPSDDAATEAAATPLRGSVNGLIGTLRKRTSSPALRSSASAENLSTSSSVQGSPRGLRHRVSSPSGLRIGRSRSGSWGSASSAASATSLTAHNTDPDDGASSTASTRRLFGRRRTASMTAARSSGRASPENVSPSPSPVPSRRSRDTRRPSTSSSAPTIDAAVTPREQPRPATAPSAPAAAAAPSAHPARPPPHWTLPDVSEELEHLLPKPYLGVAAIDDFLHAIERTGPLGFRVDAVDHPVTVRHGTADALVGCAGARTMAARCGWRFVEYDGASHLLFSRRKAMAEAMENVVAGLRGAMIADLF